jgi:hypothetical protein
MVTARRRQRREGSFPALSPVEGMYPSPSTFEERNILQSTEEYPSVNGFKTRQSPSAVFISK